MFVALVVGVGLSIRRAKRVGVDPQVIMDMAVWLLVSGLVGARLTYVIFHLDEFQGRWLDMISPFQSDGTIGIAGLVVLGSILGAIPAAYIFTKRRNLPFWKIVDIFIPGLALAMGIGRIGCFLNGCCFGLPTDLPWGVHFPETCHAGYASGGVAIHPTQIYELIGDFAIAGVLLWRTAKVKFEGELFMMFLIMVGIFRFFIETIRYYGEDKLVLLNLGTGHFTFSMLVSLLMSVFGLYMLMRGYKHPTKGARKK